MKKLCLGLGAAALLAGPAFAEDVLYPAYDPYPFHRSHVTRRVVRIGPYGSPYHVRVYGTPQMPPYYNVPAYRVITPY